MFGSLAPVLIPGASGEDPHHAAEESLTPIRPCLAAVLPLAVFGIQREEIGIIGDQRLNLSLRELQRLCSPRLQRRSRIKPCHRWSPRRSRQLSDVIDRRSAAGASHGTRLCPRARLLCQRRVAPPKLRASPRPPLSQTLQAA